MRSKLRSTPATTSLLRAEPIEAPKRKSGDVRHRGRVALVTLVASLLASSSRAAPTIDLDDRDAKLTISDLAPDAPPTIELTSDDALPIAWTRGTTRSAALPLVLMPGVVDPIVMSVLKQPRSIVVANHAVPHVTIEPARYATLATWHASSPPEARRATLLLAVAMATTLLLAALLRRGAAITVTAIALAWAAGLALATRPPALIERDDADGSRWFLATEPQTLRVPIRAGEAWVPAVESTEHLRVLSPRIVVDGKNATIELTLPAGAKIGFRSPLPTGRGLG